MKHLFIFLTSFVFSVISWTQSPEKMSYQAVIRNSTGEIVSNQAIGIQISILQNSIEGTTVYVESHNPTTNLNGLITLEVGNGTVITGDFSAIDWYDGPYFIKTETDLSGGDTYTITGTSQLLSVPYALHSKTAENITGELNERDPIFETSPANNITNGDISNWNTKLSEELDGSVTNELQSISLSNDTIYLSDGGFVKLPGASSFSGSFNDLEDVPANLDTDFTDDFDGSFSSLTDVPSGLSDGDDNTQLSETEVDAFVANNGYLTFEVDGSVTNEIQVITISNDTIYLSNGGFVKLPESSSFSGSFNDLTDVPANLDTDYTDDFDGSFSSLTDVPSGLSDGDDNTQLSETEVDAFVANNGYLTSEVDGSVTNEIELPAQTGNSGKFLTTDGTSPSWDTPVGSSTSVRTVSANTTLTSTDEIVIINGAYTVTLPASPADGQRIHILAHNSAAIINSNGKTVYTAEQTFTNLAFSDYMQNHVIYIYSSTTGYWYSIY